MLDKAVNVKLYLLVIHNITRAVCTTYVISVRCGIQGKCIINKCRMIP